MKQAKRLKVSDGTEVFLEPSGEDEGCGYTLYVHGDRIGTVSSDGKTGTSSKCYLFVEEASLEETVEHLYLTAKGMNNSFLDNAINTIVDLVSKLFK